MADPPKPRRRIIQHVIIPCPHCNQMLPPEAITCTRCGRHVSTAHALLDSPCVLLPRDTDINHPGQQPHPHNRS